MRVAACVLLMMSSNAVGTAAAKEWVLDAEASRLTFASIKAEHIGESHRFTALRGKVGDDGRAVVEIRLDSVDTGIEIRDERMRELLFDTRNHPLATIRVQADPRGYKSLKTGESVVRDAEAQIDLTGVTSAVTASLVVTRIGKERVLVEPQNLVVLDAGAFELEDGVKKLAEIAGLDSISFAVPVGFSFYFDER